VLEGKLGTTDTTAQVHPGQFTSALMQAAQESGAELRIGEVTGLRRAANDGRVIGVEVEGQVLMPTRL
jgi:glycine/D-amino acid oxidase-like deaminating enzyme